MGFSFNSELSEITGEFLTVRSASEISGYNQQYLRRLLRNRVFQSRKIGQTWLIDKKSFLDYLKMANKSKDKIDASAKHINEIMKIEGFDKAHLVGVSMGSLIAQYFALNYPEKTKSERPDPYKNPCKPSLRDYFKHNPRL